MLRRSNIILLWGLIASVSGYFVLNFYIKSISDRIALISFVFSLGAAINGVLEQRKIDNFKTLKETKDAILLEVDDLKKYTLNQVKEIKYESEKNDARHDNTIILLTQQIDAIKIRFEHHIEEASHLYTTKELLKLKEQIGYIKAIVNEQTKYTDVHLRLLKLEKMFKITKDYSKVDSEQLSKEIQDTL
jgi:hypothetical protein